MTYQIEYAYTCHIGKVRNNNEDNFWCCGKSLEAQNQGMDHIQTGCARQSELPLLAVWAVKAMERWLLIWQHRPVVNIIRISENRSEMPHKNFWMNYAVK